MAVRLSDAGDDLAPNADINITPFIDVMLVLLIIFMVAAPLSTVDVNVELPVATGTPTQRPDDPVFVTIHQDLSLSVGEEAISLGDLNMRLGIATQLKLDTRIYINADRSVPYGEVMAVMNRMRGEGYLKIGLVGLEDESGQTSPAAPSEDKPE
ncbi:TonB system transport protein ExbD [Sulfitobacter sp. S223]|uniref:TonB system transport protein ExbD n=1 Tax=Sulfitobacter sp. S223 TaxID=2867023 RepID=UPI0021A34354|nr:TonB system transport protein ExbD [Sulfitobacter sp. S223]UWR25667.1 TonB system transport protein ExbD [Sulfitobacter sp. S223]